MKTKQKANLLTICVDHISSCMGPVIPILIAGGLVKLLVVILTMTGLLAEGSSTEAVLSLIGDAPLYFLPFLVAYTASIHFKVNTPLAIGAVGAMMSPDFISLVAGGGSLSFAGIPLVGADYAYSTIPIILLVASMIFIERLVHRCMPKVLDEILSPLVILLLSSLAGLLLIGPIGTLIGNLLSDGMAWLQLHSPVLAWSLFAGILPLLVITGMHWVFVAVALADLGATGVDAGIMVAFFILSLAQSGACLAVFFRSKSTSIRKLALSCSLTVFLTGVTEPPIYGITLKYKRPLITSMIGAAVAGAYQGLVTIHCYVYAFPGLPSCLMFSDPSEPGNLAKALIAAAIAFAASFLLTFFFGGSPSESPEGEAAQ